MARYTVTLYIHPAINARGVLTSLQVSADDREGAQDAAISQCEQAGRIHGNIVSIVRQLPRKLYGSHGQ